MIPDYWMGLLGGLMIGCAAALFLLGNGRVMGASGILGSTVDGSATGTRRTEQLVFMAALIGVPALASVLFGAVPTGLTGNPVVILAGGLCVGLGTRLANGCTSGHGVCGISRLSLRGIGATLVYILAGAGTVLVFRHMLGVI